MGHQDTEGQGGGLLRVEDNATQPVAVQPPVID